MDRFLLLIVFLFLAACGSQATTAITPTTSKYVLIVAGQSNATGRATNPISDGDVANYKFTRTSIWVKGAWQIFNPADCTQNYEAIAGTHGIEPYLAYQFERTYPNDSLYIIKFSEGGTSLAVDPIIEDWSPSSNELFGIFKENYLAPALKSPELASGYVPMGFWWAQGEADALKSQWADEYYLNLDNFFSELIKDLPAIANFKRYIGRVRSNPVWTYGDKVRAAEMQYSTASDNTVLIDTDYVDVNPGDSMHYSATGYSKLATTLFGAMRP